jgi:hypothetical protein
MTNLFLSRGFPVDYTSLQSQPALVGQFAGEIRSWGDASIVKQAGGMV